MPTAGSFRSEAATVMVMVTWAAAGVAIITDGAEGIIAAGDTTTDDFYGEGRLLGDDRIRSARHQRRNRAVVILDVQLAVGGAEQLADFRHHPRLVLCGLGPGGVAGQDDLHRLVNMVLGVVPAL